MLEHDRWLVPKGTPVPPTQWAYLLEQNLKANRPKEYRKLLKSGELWETCKVLAEAAFEESLALERSGMGPYEAAETAMREYIYPASEREERERLRRRRREQKALAMGLLEE